MIRDPPWQTTLRRYDVNVRVPVIIPAEGNARAIRGKSRKRLFTFRRTQPLRVAAAFRHDPDISGVDEHDLRRRHVRESQHAGINRTGRGAVRVRAACKRRSAEAAARGGKGEREYGFHWSPVIMLKMTMRKPSQFLLVSATPLRHDWLLGSCKIRFSAVKDGDRESRERGGKH